MFDFSKWRRPRFRKPGDPPPKKFEISNAWSGVISLVSVAISCVTAYYSVLFHPEDVVAIPSLGGGWKFNIKDGSSERYNTVQIILANTGEKPVVITRIAMDQDFRTPRRDCGSTDARYVATYFPEDLSINDREKPQLPVAIETNYPFVISFQYRLDYPDSIVDLKTGEFGWPSRESAALANGLPFDLCLSITFLDRKGETHRVEKWMASGKGEELDFPTRTSDEEKPIRLLPLPADQSERGQVSLSALHMRLP